MFLLFNTTSASTCLKNSRNLFSPSLYLLTGNLILFLICRTLSEFWHWFVANVPGDSVDDGEVIFELLFPLVLPEGDGDHR